MHEREMKYTGGKQKTTKRGVKQYKSCEETGEERIKA